MQFINNSIGKLECKFNNEGDNTLIINTTPGESFSTIITGSAPPPMSTHDDFQTITTGTHSAPPSNKNSEKNQSKQQQQQVREINPIRNIHKNITTIGDLSLSEYSPSTAEYTKLLAQQSSYFKDYYSSYYNDHLTPEQNILAFQHFEKTNKVNIGINTNIDEQPKSHSQNFIPQQVLNMKNQSDSDGSNKNEYNKLIQSNVLTLINLYKFAFRTDTK